MFCEKIVNAPFKFVSNTIDDFRNLKDIQKENDILKENIDKIGAIEAENIELKNQIEALKRN